MRVLITGGAGFIGSHLVEMLHKRDHRVSVIDIETGWSKSFPSDVLYVKDDVCNYSLVREVLREEMPQEIVHLAGVSHTVSSALGQRSALHPGVIGLATIQDAVREVYHFNGPPRISIASSSLLSGMLKPMAGFEWMVANDETVLNMQDCYHQYCDNKLMMEMLCWSNQYQFHIPFNIFRFGTQYGPRMRPNVVTWYFIRNALLGVPLQIHGDGTQIRQHFFVEDLVVAMTLILEQRAYYNHVTSIVPNHMTSVKEIAETIKALMPSTEIQYVDSRPIDVKVRQIAPSPVLDSMGWEQRINLQEGIARTIDFYRGRMDLVREGFDQRIKEQN